MSLFYQMKIAIQIFSPIKSLIIILIWNIFFEKLLLNNGHKEQQKKMETQLGKPEFINQMAGRRY